MDAGPGGEGLGIVEVKFKRGKIEAGFFGFGVVAFEAVPGNEFLRDGRRGFK
jgi:hypothetical protein